MHSKQLDAEQVQRLLVRVKRDLHYLDCLEGRMHQKHFPLDDPLYEAVKKARVAVSGLSSELNQLLGGESGASGAS
jgi:hypothetical protein